MSAPNTVTKMPKWKLYVLSAVIVIGVIGLIFCGTRSVTAESSVADYAITRTCDFVTVGDLTGLFCTDGSKWQVTAIDPLVLGQ